MIATVPLTINIKDALDETPVFLNAPIGFFITDRQDNVILFLHSTFFVYAMTMLMLDKWGTNTLAKQC
jgi:hypothetical protein